MKQRTYDRARAGTGPPGVAGMHTTEQIGPKRHRTPEGYLLCEDVPIARTGWQIYGPNESPIKTNDLGFAMVARDESTLFSPITMMSFSGKSVTNDHPYGGVTPRNWKQVTVGSVHNVRRGTGDEADTMRADLLITDADAITAVESGKREVSAGYDATYETTGVGEGRQVRIIGNHIALVAKGRCGPRCAIGDQAPVLQPLKGKANMPARNTTTRRQVTDEQRAHILQSLGIEGPGDDEEGDDDGEEGHVHVHLHNGAKTGDAASATLDAAVDSRFTAIETTLVSMSKALEKLVGTADTSASTGESDDEEEDEEMTPPKKKGKTGDSAALQTSYTELLADAEVLVPGFRVPTFDAAADRKATIDSMCAIRRKALDTVNATTDGATLLKVLAGATVDNMVTMDCKAIASLFRSAAGAKKLVNNTASTATAHRTGDSAAGGAQKPKGAQSIAELQAMNREMYPFTAI